MSLTPFINLIKATPRILTSFCSQTRLIQPTLDLCYLVRLSRAPQLIPSSTTIPQLHIRLLQQLAALIATRLTLILV